MEQKEKEEDPIQETVVDEIEQQFLEQYYVQLNVRDLDVRQIVDRMNLLRTGSRSLEDIRSVNEATIVPPAPKEDPQPTPGCSSQPDQTESQPKDTLKLENIPTGCVRSEPSSPTRGGMFIHSLVDYFGNSGGDPFNKPYWPLSKALQQKLQSIIATNPTDTTTGTQAPRPIVKTNWRQPEGTTPPPESKPSTSKDQPEPNTGFTKLEEQILKFKSSKDLAGGKVSQPRYPPRNEALGRYRGNEQTTESGGRKISDRDSPYSRGGRWRAEMNQQQQQQQQPKAWNQIFFQGVEQVDIAAKPIPIMASVTSPRVVYQTQFEDQRSNGQGRGQARGRGRGQASPSGKGYQQHGYLKETIASKSKESLPAARRQSQPPTPPKDVKATKPLRQSPSKPEVVKEKETPGYFKETFASKCKEKPHKDPTADPKKSNPPAKRPESSPTPSTSSKPGSADKPQSSKSCVQTSADQPKPQGKRYTTTFGKDSQKVFTQENVAEDNKVKPKLESTPPRPSVSKTNKKEESTKPEPRGSLSVDTINKPGPNTPFMARKLKSEDKREFQPDFAKYHKKEKKGNPAIKSKSSGSLFSKEPPVVPQHSTEAFRVNFDRYHYFKNEAGSIKAEGQKQATEATASQPVRQQPGFQVNFSKYQQREQEKKAREEVARQEQQTSVETAGPSRQSEYPKPGHSTGAIPKRPLPKPQEATSPSAHTRPQLHPDFNQRDRSRKSDDGWKIKSGRPAEERRDDNDAWPNLRPGQPFGLGSSQPSRNHGRPTYKNGHGTKPPEKPDQFESENKPKDSGKKQ